MSLIDKTKKQVGINAFKVFLHYCDPKSMTRRIHNHEKHSDDVESISELEREALYFLKDKCVCIEDFQNKNESILYNENLLCLYNAIHRFMETGSREAAFDVYYSLINIVSVKNYAEARQLIEMLSNFENTASNLVLKHRDHYSHSVYVFIIGLAIFNSNEKLREAYTATYFNDSDAMATQEDVALEFLQFWGVTALFHDIGYPFEIPFEQIKSYFKFIGKVNEDSAPYISYRQISDFLSLKNALENAGDIEKTEYDSCVRRLLERKVVDDIDDVTIGEVIAHHIFKRLGGRKVSEEQIMDILLTKPTNPNKYNYYMDHALFSGILFFRKLISMFGIDALLGKEADGKYNTKQFYGWMDSITAIILHNSLFKFSLRKVGGKKKPLKMNEHPLAYLLMLCDELQCWDRTSFGRDSKKELHAMECLFDFREGRIDATYVFEKDDKAVVVEKGEITKVKDGTFKKFLQYETDKGEKVYHRSSDAFKPEEGKPETWCLQLGSDEAEDCIFYNDISDIVDLSDLTDNRVAGLRVAAKMDESTKFREDSLSNIKLINIYDLAVELYWDTHKADGNGEALFAAQPLAVQLSYIQVVKNMAGYLDSIGVLYTDEPLALTRKRADDFTFTERRFIYSLEEERQKYEKIQMCRGGITASFLEKLNKNPYDVANYYVESIKNPASSVNLIDVSVKTLIDSMFRILDSECNMYYLPLKRTLRAEYDKDTIARIVGEDQEGKKYVDLHPDRVIERDTAGNTIRVFGKEQLYYEEAYDYSASGEEYRYDKLYLVHVKDYYSRYELAEYDEAMDAYYYSYSNNDGAPDTLLRLLPEWIDDEEAEEDIICLELQLVEKKAVDTDDSDEEISIIKTIDRMMYYIEKDDEDNWDYSHIMVRHAPDGCLELTDGIRK